MIWSVNRSRLLQKIVLIYISESQQISDVHEEGDFNHGARVRISRDVDLVTAMKACTSPDETNTSTLLIRTRAP